MRSILRQQGPNYIRFKYHQISILKNRKDFPMANHFNESNHSLKDLKVCFLGRGCKSAEDRECAELWSTVHSCSFEKGVKKDLYLYGMAASIYKDYMHTSLAASANNPRPWICSHMTQGMIIRNWITTVQDRYWPRRATAVNQGRELFHSVMSFCAWTWSWRNSFDYFGGIIWYNFLLLLSKNLPTYTNAQSEWDSHHHVNCITLSLTHAFQNTHAGNTTYIYGCCLGYTEIAHTTKISILSKQIYSNHLWALSPWRRGRPTKFLN